MLSEFTISVYILKIKGTYSNGIQEKKNQEKIDPPDINPRTGIQEQVLYLRGIENIHIGARKGMRWENSL